LVAFISATSIMGREVQMDELDMWMLQSLIRSKGCSSGTLYEEGKDRNLPLPLLLAISENLLATTFGTDSRGAHMKHANVFMIDGGAPEFFVLTGLASPAIWYSKTYIDMHLRFREIIMAENGFERGTAHLFETLGSFYMSLGNEAFARTCFLQSLIEMPSDTKNADYYDGSSEVASRFCFSDQAVQGSEAAMVALYFGLAHELGHVYDPRAKIGKNEQKHPVSLERNAIRDALLKAGKEILKANMLEYSYDRWSKEAEREFDDPKSILYLDSLRSEIVADWIGFQILFRFMEFASNRIARTYNKKMLISEVVIGLFIIQLLEQCRHLAKNNLTKISELHGDAKKATLSSLHVPLDMLDMVEDDVLRAQLAQTDVLTSFAAVHRARIEFLKPTLTTCILLHLFPDTFMVRGNAMAARVSQAELSRRESVASSNLEGYFFFYHDSFMKLLARFGDLVLFAAHLVTGSPPPPELNPQSAGNLSEAIAANFLVHFAQLEVEGEPGKKRRSDILRRLSEYVIMLKRRGIVDEVLFSAHDHLLKASNRN
jgi:hypothetical protein